jgi:hypothetical protein
MMRIAFSLVDQRFSLSNYVVPSIGRQAIDQHTLSPAQI